MYRSRSPFSISILALVTLVVGLAITMLLFVAARRYEHYKAVTELEQRASVRFAAFREGVAKAVDDLRTVNRLFATVEPVSRAQFKTFTQALLARDTFLQAFTFQRLVSASGRATFEADMQRNFPGFSVIELLRNQSVPAGARAQYRVIDYIEPFQDNQRVFGLDLASTPYQDDAVQRARDTGLASATDLYLLPHRSLVQRGFVVLMPVYRHGVALDDTASRRSATVGYTAAVFRADALVRQILDAGALLGEYNVDISVYGSLYGGTSGRDEHALVFRHGNAPPVRTAPTRLPPWLFYNRPDPISDTVDVAGKRWQVIVSSQPVWFLDSRPGLIVLLVMGPLFSLLAAVLLQFMITRSQRVHALVQQRTAELRLANAMLITDIAARQRIEAALQLRERAIEASANAIIITSANAPGYVIEYINPAFERITGYPEAEVLGRSCNFLWGDDGDQAGVIEITESASNRREGHAIVRTYRKDGTPFWSDVYIAPVKDDAGIVNHFVAALYDITAAKSHEAELEFQANRDILTGLANRSLLRDRLAQAIAFGERYRHPIWIVFIDLDRFKFVNDTLGHKAGDLLLQRVAERLQSAVRETDTVARLGGDEFVLVLSERADEHLEIGVVQRIMKAVAQPLMLDEHEFFVTCSVGVAVYPTDGADPDSLIKYADIAMYRAKEIGRNNSQFYTPAMNQRALERLRIEGDLRNAIERNEFLLHYQPQVDLRTGRIVAMEALIRWQHPERGLIAPGLFIGVAEETALIVPIGSWVIRNACAQNKAWQESGLGYLRVAVNLSARQFAQHDLVESIAAVLAETGLEAHFLELELTESVVMTDIDRAIDILSRLKTLGVQLAIDDFGTGHSSLSNLKRLPVNVLKIDQSFVRDITADPDDAAIVLSVISLAHSLRLQVIAEGVETEAQLAYLRRHHCDLMQGYYFSRPVASLDFAHMLQVGKRLAIPDEEATRARQTLLIVDDEANVVAALSRLLCQDGYEILSAATAAQGFELLALHRVQVILCDQRMPQMNGTDFLEKVKDLYPDTIRIVLSGYTDFQAVINAINRGAIHRFFNKPWDSEVLRKNVRDAFQHHALLRAASGPQHDLSHVSDGTPQDRQPNDFTTRLGNDDTTVS